MLHICDIRSILNRNKLSTFGYIFTVCTYVYSGPVSVVGIATTYGLVGGGIESRKVGKFSAPIQNNPCSVQLVP